MLVIAQRKNQEAYQAALARSKEIDVLYEKLFEEKILGNLTEERFCKLSQKYEDEQAELKQKIRNLKKIVDEEKQNEMNADGFLALVRKYSNFQELTPEILREFIDKIVVYNKEKRFGETVQRVEIYYKMIGHIELPQISRSKLEEYSECLGNKKTDRIA